MHSNSIVLNLLILFVFTCDAFDADEDVIFKLYKREDAKNFTVLALNESRTISNDTFEPQLPTRIHIHGFLPKEEIIDRYRQVYLNAGDYNFIVVDWSEGASTINYISAKNRVNAVS